MPNNWTLLPLGECLEWRSGGTPSKSNPAYWGGEIPWVSAKDMKTFRLYSAEDKITDLGAKNGTRTVEPGTILMLVRGMTLHNDVPICIAMRRMAFNQDVKAILPRMNVDCTFLAYLLLANKPFLLASVDSASHGTGRLYSDILDKLEIALPPYSEQQAIARVLGSLDDKIELNRRMNETLEQIARALFQSWFVDFDPVRAKAEGRQPFGMDAETAALFPDSFVDSALGEIPEGWQIVQLRELAEKISKGTTPTQAELNAAVEPSTIPFFKAKDITDDCQISYRNVERIPVSIHEGSLRRSILTKYDILYTIAGTIGRCALFDTELSNANVNQAVAFIRITNKQAHIPLCFMELKSVRAQEAMLPLVVQAVQANLSLTNIGSYKLVLPPDSILSLWSQMFWSIHNRQSALLAENRTLEEIRDSLLPKLLSGEVRVREAEELLEVCV